MASFRRRGDLIYDNVEELENWINSIRRTLISKEVKQQKKDQFDLGKARQGN